MSQTIALVVAAGRGNRLQADRPKQYLPLAGRSILRHALAGLARHPQVGAVRAVIHPDDAEVYAEVARGLNALSPVYGGASRQESVRRGLESLAEMAPARVLIHDGARPFVTEDTVERVLDALDRHSGAVPAIPVADTLKLAGGNATIAATVPRDGLWRAQTPQGFRYDAILQAHRNHADADANDDAALAERAGLSVALVEGSPENIKVTTPEDFVRAERWLAGGQETRVGQGFDVHRFADAPGPVMLCGVPVPHARALSGHSDADVGLHVVVDAVLGALAEGDIGQHFPPSDSQWKNADSADFVTYAAALVRGRGATIQHVDVTLICERPQIGPHRPAMVGRIADLLGLPARRVSVKGTTTERLGFTGRGEGIAAQAVVTLRLPTESA